MTINNAAGSGTPPPNMWTQSFTATCLYLGTSRVQHAASLQQKVDYQENIPVPCCIHVSPLPSEYIHPLREKHMIMSVNTQHVNWHLSLSHKKSLEWDEVGQLLTLCIRYHSTGRPDQHAPLILFSEASSTVCEHRSLLFTFHQQMKAQLCYLKTNKHNTVSQTISKTALTCICFTITLCCTNPPPCAPLKEIVTRFEFWNLSLIVPSNSNHAVCRDRISGQWALCLQPEKVRKTHMGEKKQGEKCL